MNPHRTDGSTVGPSARLAGTDPGIPRETLAVPVLTLLFHPDLRRVGDRVVLSEIPLGREALVGRQEPEFCRPGSATGGPLADRHVSRHPLRFQPAPQGGVVLHVGESRTRVTADGDPVLTARELSAAEVERGVVLVLSDRIVLLLHVLRSLPAEPAERFELVGASQGIVRVRWEVRRVADLDVPVLLRGETGTGKELVARALHESGPRRNGPFVGVNLGALPPSLVASELFGAVKGAYTGSVQGQEGYFRRAHGGTLFLDEVGEAPPEVQVMLLRVLETREIHPIGSQAPQRVDVRVVAATDSDLEEKVRREQFRAPLLHRLAGYEIWMPPLRERRDDIGRLLLHFLAQELAAVGERLRLDADPETHTDELWLPPGLVARLARYDWPGNVRQLRNVARQLVIGSRGLPRLEVGPAVERLLDESPAAPVPHDSSTEIPVRRPEEDAGFRRKPGEVPEGELLAALRGHRWDLQAAARALRISRTSLYALIEASPNVRKAGDLRPEEIARCWEECGGDLDAMVDRLEVSKKALGRRLREMGLG
ncbi:MAG TPA: sigma 54-interacting transcriptional regulator [Thermoanaerobaculia bacterium]|nr:sigma 54-interacting transcriptional regulator [Thermoanaerobaculia bacterium]